LARRGAKPDTDRPMGVVGEAQAEGWKGAGWESLPLGWSRPWKVAGRTTGAAEIEEAGEKDATAGQRGLGCG